jgi:hypothetical protein
MGLMKQFVGWPPPEWTEIVITWDKMLTSDEHDVNDIQEWVNTMPGNGRFHLHGWKSTEGFAYRFEDPKDAIIFAMKWS